LKLIVYKTLKTQVKPAASVEWTEKGVEIRANEKMIVAIILQAIKSPQVVRVRGGNRVVHKKPATVGEHIQSALKNKLHFPYWVGPAKKTVENVSETVSLGTLDIEKVMGQDHKDVDTQLRAVDNTHGLGIKKSPA
jgi:hypothetical protein